MAVYTNDLRLKEIGTGDESGTWGVSTNTNLSLIADGFSYGTLSVAADANETFTIPDGTADASRGLYIKFTSAGSLTATRTLTLGPNTVSKVWIIENATSGSQSIIIKQGSGAEVTITTGANAIIYTDGAGAGAAVVNSLTDITLVTPLLGTPASGVATNLTGLPITTGVSGLGSGVATWLATPSSANFLTVMTDETGTGSLVFATSPQLTTPLLGTPTSGVATNLTGLPLTTGVTGTLPVANGGTGITAFGTGVATALGINVGSSGSPLVNAGVLGTPSSGTATNLTGLPLSTGVTGTLPIANGGTAATTQAAARVNLLPSYASKAGYALGVNGGETDVEFILFPGSGTVTSVALSGGTTGLTTSGGPVTAAGTITLAGTLVAANGGTGITALGTGVATAIAVNVGSAGAFTTFNGDAGTPSALVLTNASGTVTNLTLVNPALGIPASGTLTNATGLPLTTGVTGTLPVANGGTGAATLTANYALLGNGTSAPQMIAPGTSGNILTSNGTTWASTASAAPVVPAGAIIYTALNFGGF